MARSSSALVRICQTSRWVLLAGALSTSFIPSPAAPQESAGAPSDPHSHHRAAAAPASGSAASPGTSSIPSLPPMASAPSRSTAITTPSWFVGGEGLYVPPYFDSFSGIDLTSLSPSQKERFLHKVNTEFCACNQTGCRRDTIAHCYVTDTACPRAPVRIREILEKAKSQGQDGGAPPSPSVTITPRS